MKKFLVFILFTAIAFCLPSCGSSKEGCGLEEKYNNPDMETTKRGKSTLFSKKQTSRMKKKS
ncbi:MAG: hypothetical protein LW630_11795 [Saprospiraceae bacterium]|nr:hypothetical protein [Saprospiraceae bacterium]